MFGITRKAQTATAPVAVETDAEILTRMVEARVTATFALGLDISSTLCTDGGLWCTRTDIHADHDAMMYDRY